MASVEERVKQIIVEQLGVDEAEVTPTASFVDDLGADSLDQVELVMAFEEALGIGTEESWKNLLAGVSGVATITSFDATGFDCRIAGEVKNFDPFRWIEKKELKKMGRFIQIALAGAD